MKRGMWSFRAHKSLDLLQMRSIKRNHRQKQEAQNGKVGRLHAFSAGWPIANLRATGVNGFGQSTDALRCGETVSCEPIILPVAAKGACGLWWKLSSSAGSGLMKVMICCSLLLGDSIKLQMFESIAIGHSGMLKCCQEDLLHPLRLFEL